MLQFGAMHDAIRTFRNVIGVLLIVASIFSILPIAITPSLAQPIAAVTKTEVITFAPPLPTGSAREGSCWTTSIAVTRPGAYRCMVGNSIEDPCFAVPPNRDKLVCGANPILKQDGFVLKLTKPLPTDVPPPSVSPQPWIIKLADGSSCVAMTGTLVAVNGEPARWSCAIHIRDQIRRMGVITTITPGKIWTAERFAESAIANPASGARRVTGETLPIKTIWE
ncbi:MAG: hypothetical protein Q7S58_04725 [Candidatus Binatus sp.]|uniref:hypothetical protein n=1 Tax=Candidatus Binatus sp. TaxID=2811406 RepID=UPI00271C9483|nr:hypothetical protein [Candidatus Binatus sp.]MDO8431698.1 hypothetical protein [Candidatus Binatus sp.]